MAGKEGVAGGDEVDAVLVRRGRARRSLGRSWPSRKRARSTPSARMREAPSGVDVGQLRHEVGVGSAAGGVQHERQRPRDLQRLGERRRAVDEHVGALLQRALVERPRVRAQEARGQRGRARRSSAPGRPGRRRRRRACSSPGAPVERTPSPRRNQRCSRARAERPVLLVAPAVLAHHEDPHRRRRLLGRPAQLLAEERQSAPAPDRCASSPPNRRSRGPGRGRTCCRGPRARPAAASASAPARSPPRAHARKFSRVPPRKTSYQPPTLQRRDLDWLVAAVDRERAASSRRRWDAPASRGRSGPPQPPRAAAGR